jgi:hypothetical protein
MLQIFFSKIPFYEKVKMTTKGLFVIESFVIVGSFDCDCNFVITDVYVASIT